MAQIRLTKNELRAQQHRLAQLEKYLPTLQLKKAMLQTQVFEARLEVERFRKEEREAQEVVDHFSPLLDERLALDFKTVAKVSQVRKSYENIAGVEIPQLDGISFEPVDYTLFDTPPWVDGAIRRLQACEVARVTAEIADEKRNALEAELREVSIRVNLFEKILIPRANGHIKKIKIFLGDQELAAVSQAKVAKKKIMLMRELAHA